MMRTRKPTLYFCHDCNAQRIGYISQGNLDDTEWHDCSFLAQIIKDTYRSLSSGRLKQILLGDVYPESFVSMVTEIINEKKTDLQA